MLNFKTLSIMKTRLLKITLSFAMLFIAAGAFAQQLEDENGDPLPNLAEDSKSNDIDSVTTGYTVPYYVTPDPIVNSGYVEPYDTSGANAGLNSTWDWKFTDGSHFTDTTQKGDLGPYIEVTWADPTTIGSGSGAATSITVAEKGPGNCDGADSTLTVNVFDPPEFTFIDGTNGGITNADAPDASGVIEICDDGTGVQEDILIAEIFSNNIAETGDFKFRLDKDVYTIDAEGNTINQHGESIDSIATVAVNFGQGIVLHSGHDLSTINGEITRYRFDFGSTIAGGTNNNGITDPIHRKSQYLTNPGGENGNNDQGYEYIAVNTAVSDMLTIKTYPAPETGNIHYVPNNFDQ